LLPAGSRQPDLAKVLDGTGGRDKTGGINAIVVGD
jgi:hypothetical protein